MKDEAWSLITFRSGTMIKYCQIQLSPYLGLKTRVPAFLEVPKWENIAAFKTMFLILQYNDFITSRISILLLNRNILPTLDFSILAYSHKWLASFATRVIFSSIHPLKAQ